MLLRITNHCTMGCSHCMIDANKYGGHMTTDVFKKAIEFNKTFDRSVLIISGGEPMNHPDIIPFLYELKKYNKSTGKVLILSNGLFLENEKKRKEILNFGIEFQITNDNRFYPKKIIKINHPLLTYEYKIRKISPFGRAIKNNIYDDKNKKAPLCFNLRSCAYNSINLKDAILKLRVHHNFCTPSINIDGSIVLGETPFCYTIGSINDKPEEIFNNIINASCDKCKLSKNLSEINLAYWKLMEANLL